MEGMQNDLKDYLDSRKWLDDRGLYGLPDPGKYNEMKPIFVLSNRWVLE
jgi:hypothetical protein